MNTDNNIGFDNTYWLKREARVSTNSIFNYTEEFSYDAMGNRTQRRKSVQGGAFVNTDYTYNAANQLTSNVTSGVQTDYSYDDNGNLVQKQTGADLTTYGFDSLDRMTSATVNGVTSAYSYDVFGKRIRKNLMQSGGGVTEYWYQNTDTLAEVDGSTQAVQATYNTPFLDENVSMNRSGQIYYYQQDGLGSVRNILDSVQNISNRYDYNAFGETTNSQEIIANTFKYTGRQWDNETNQYYYRSRYYSPNTGRFDQKDKYKTIENYSSYDYTQNNPVLYMDPEGKEPVSIAIAIGAGFMFFFGIGKYADAPGPSDKVYGGYTPESTGWAISGLTLPLGGPFAKGGQSLVSRLIGKSFFSTMIGSGIGIGEWSVGNTVGSTLISEGRLPSNSEIFNSFGTGFAFGAGGEGVLILGKYAILPGFRYVGWKIRGRTTGGIVNEEFKTIGTFEELTSETGQKVRIEKVDNVTKYVYEDGSSMSVTTSFDGSAEVVVQEFKPTSIKGLSLLEETKYKIENVNQYGKASFAEQNLENIPKSTAEPARPVEVKAPDAGGGLGSAPENAPNKCVKPTETGSNAPKPTEGASGGQAGTPEPNTPNPKTPNVKYNTVKETFKTPADAIGDTTMLGPDKVGGPIPTDPVKNKGFYKDGFTEMHQFRSGIDGVTYSVFYNPKTGDWSGSHVSSIQTK